MHRLFLNNFFKSDRKLWRGSQPCFTILSTKYVITSFHSSDIFYTPYSTSCLRTSLECFICENESYEWNLPFLGSLLVPFIVLHSSNRPGTSCLSHLQRTTDLWCQKGRTKHFWTSKERHALRFDSGSLPKWMWISQDLTSCTSFLPSFLQVSNTVKL